MFFKSMLIFLFIYSCCVVGIFIDSTNSSNLKANIGIIYGNKVELTGEPSERLKARLNAGLQLYETDIIGKLIVSGGIGKEGYDEARIMANYLLQRGVETQDIVIDSNGYNTNMTSFNTFKMFDNNSSVVAISQKYHVSRSKMSLRNAGFQHVYGFSPEYTELRDVYAYLREVPAWFKYWLFNL